MTILVDCLTSTHPRIRIVRRIRLENTPNIPMQRKRYAVSSLSWVMSAPKQKLQMAPETAYAQKSLLLRILRLSARRMFTANTMSQSAVAKRMFSRRFFIHYPKSSNIGLWFLPTVKCGNNACLSGKTVLIILPQTVRFHKPGRLKE